jgi:hypothetical protein
MRSGQLDVQIYGAVAPAQAEALSAHLAAAYARLAPAPRAVLAVRLVDTRERMAALAAADKARHGISTAGDEGFTCAHDAFEDAPRITVCVEALGDPRGPALAALRHEVGHAVLHGRRVFYEVRLDAALRRAGAHRGLGDQALLQLLFFIAVAVKDWEVSRLLLRQGFAADVRALAWELLAPSEEDRRAWQIAAPIEELRLLWAASQLKPLLHAAPLRALAEGPEVEARAREMLTYLPPPACQALLALAWRLAAALGDETHENIAQATASLLAAGF